jgi:hypothetical protein
MDAGQAADTKTIDKCVVVACLCSGDCWVAQAERDVPP